MNNIQIFQFSWKANIDADDFIRKMYALGLQVHLLDEVDAMSDDAVYGVSTQPLSYQQAVTFYQTH
jgi:hypothetical protein